MLSSFYIGTVVANSYILVSILIYFNNNYVTIVFPFGMEWQIIYSYQINVIKRMLIGMRMSYHLLSWSQIFQIASSSKNHNKKKRILQRVLPEFGVSRKWGIGHPQTRGDITFVKIIKMLSDPHVACLLGIKVTSLLMIFIMHLYSRDIRNKQYLY